MGAERVMTDQWAEDGRVICSENGPSPYGSKGTLLASQGRRHMEAIHSRAGMAWSAHSVPFLTSADLLLPSLNGGLRHRMTRSRAGGAA